MPTNPPILLRATEAASLLGLHTETLRRWRVEGRGPAFVKLSRARVRYSRQAIDQWITAHERKSEENGRRGAS